MLPFPSSVSLRMPGGILLHLFQTAFLVADFKLVILVYLFLGGKVEGDGDA